MVISEAASDVDLLLGPDAAVLLSAVVAQYGGTLQTPRAVNVRVQPGGGAVVEYVAQVHRDDGTQTRELLVAATGTDIPPGAAVVAGEFRGAPVHVAVWRWPQDPALPALAGATHPEHAAALLREHGLSAARQVDVTVRAYRPGRRAVLEITEAQQRWFIKVVRPAEVADLCTRHDLLHRQVPVPPVLAATPDGAVVLPAAPGRPLRELITAGEALPEPTGLEAVLDALPENLMTLPRRRACLQRVPDAVAVLRDTAGDRPGVLSMLDEVAAQLDSPPPADVMPAHGDFYEAQLLAAGGEITGLLDVDTAGPGERADEWATLLGHLAVAGRADAGAHRYCTAVLAYAERRVDPVALRQRTAAVLLGLATGPFRHRAPEWPQHTAARIALARDWLAGPG